MKKICLLALFVGILSFILPVGVLGQCKCIVNTNNDCDAGVTFNVTGNNSDLDSAGIWDGFSHKETFSESNCDFIFCDDTLVIGEEFPELNEDFLSRNSLLYAEDKK